MKSVKTSCGLDKLPLSMLQTTACGMGMACLRVLRKYITRLVLIRILHRTYNTAADNSLVKQNTMVDIHGIEQQAYYQPPPPSPDNHNPAVLAPQCQQPSPPLPTTYNPNLNLNSQAQPPQYQPSPPKPSPTELSGHNNSVQSHHNYPSPSAAQELASARLRTNVSPMNGLELEGGEYQLEIRYI